MTFSIPMIVCSVMMFIMFIGCMFHPRGNRWYGMFGRSAWRDYSGPRTDYKEILGVRLAKGEIGEQEYKRILEILDKNGGKDTGRQLAGY